MFWSLTRKETSRGNVIRYWIRKISIMMRAKVKLSSAARQGWRLNLDTWMEYSHAIDDCHRMRISLLNSLDMLPITFRTKQYHKTGANVLLPQSRLPLGKHIRKTEEIEHGRFSHCIPKRNSFILFAVSWKRSHRFPRKQAGSNNKEISIKDL